MLLACRRPPALGLARSPAAPRADRHRALRHRTSLRIRATVGGGGSDGELGARDGKEQPPAAAAPSGSGDTSRQAPEQTGRARQQQEKPDPSARAASLLQETVAGPIRSDLRALHAACERLEAAAVQQAEAQREVQTLLRSIELRQLLQLSQSPHQQQPGEGARPPWDEPRKQRSTSASRREMFAAVLATVAVGGVAFGGLTGQRASAPVPTPPPTPPPAANSDGRSGAAPSGAAGTTGGGGDRTPPTAACPVDSIISLRLAESKNELRLLAMCDAPVEDLESVQELLQLGTDVNVVDVRGQQDSPLIKAIRWDHVAVAAALLAAGASACSPNAEKLRPLEAACSGAAVRMLVRYGAPVDGFDKYGETPLHSAARHGWAEAAQALLDAGARVNARNSKGMTPLHRAADVGSFEVARVLLRNGAEVDATNIRGSTSLLFAADVQSVPVIRLLLSAGADPKAANKWGFTPRSYAREEEVRRLLQTCSDS